MIQSISQSITQTMNRREFLHSSLYCTLSTIPLAKAGIHQKPPGKKPNYLFLLTDDQTFQAVNALHNPDIRTPNLDRLVREGTTFTHCFNQGAWNGAVCIASRAMLITGRHLWTCGSGHCLDPQGKAYPLWGEWLGRHGYRTMMTGKWHNGHKTLQKSFQTIGPTGPGMFPSRDTKAKENRAKGIIKDPYNRPRQGNKWDPADRSLAGHWRKHQGKLVHSSKLWADRAIAWLKKEETRQDRPFFMYVAFHAPHDPRQAPREFLEMYPRDKIKLPPNYLPLHPFDPMGNYRTLRDERLAPYPRTEEAIQLHLQEYYALITYTDQQIGRILAALQASGKAENTVVIFTADHGLAVGQHGLLGKQNQYDHSVRMPLVFKGPGIEANKRIDDLVYMQSLFATTCELSRIKTPESVEFPSLAPLLAGREINLHRSVYGAYTNQQRMVRTNSHKYIRYPMVGQRQLFDLKKDPWEQRNLAGDPRYGELVKSMDRELTRLMRRFRDPLDLKNPHLMRGPGRKKGKKTSTRK